MNFCEFDKYAVKSYCAIHNVDESLNLGDITKVDENNIPSFNMIVGGSPCQDFSVAGKQKGSVWKCKHCNHEYNPLIVHWSDRDKCPECDSKEIDKTRSSLLVEWIRVIRANKPNFGIYENVKNIVGKQFKETTFKIFEQELKEYGYNTYWKVLNAKNYGIPQNRERVYLILIKKELDNGRFNFPEPFNTGLRLKDILEDKVDEKYYLSDEKTNKLLSNLNEKEKINFSQYGIDKSYNNPDFIEIANCITSREDRGVSNRKSEGTCVCQCIGNLNPSGKGMNGNVFSEEGLSPTLTTNKGEGNKIAIKQATKLGYIECEVGGVADLSYLESKTRRGRVQSGGQIRPTLTARPEGFKTAILPVTKQLRIRKLTPKECFRLMGFPDNAFEAAYGAGVSNSQLYKQAGNSIVVDVLYYILRELYIAMPYLFDDVKLSSYFSGIGAFELALDRLFEDINSGNFTNPQAE